MQDVESKQLLYNLSESKDFTGEIRRYNLSILMTLVYGKRPESRTNSKIEELKHHIHNVSAAIVQKQSLLVEAFPILHRLPL